MARGRGRTSPIKRRDLVRRLKVLGVEEHAGSGKGSHRMPVRPKPGEPHRWLKTTLTYHSDTEDIQPSVVKSIRRKLHLAPEHGVSDARFFQEG